jgi:DNA-directed RNA polymerase subunit RPC12/RpoP
VSIDSQPKLILFLTIGFILLLFLFLFFKAFEYRCSNCKKWMALRQTGEQKISEEGAYKTVERSDFVSMGKDSGWIHRKEQIHIIRSWHKIYLRCKHCGSEFEQNEKREVEG